MDSIYYTDDYKIDGCTVMIKSSENTTGKFIVNIQAPKAQGQKTLETYYPMNIDEAIDATRCLLKTSIEKED